MTHLLLARHGQSEWNALGRWQGQADPPLSPLGELQAAHAATRLDGIDVIVASDLQRAARTAEVIAEVCGLGPVRVDPRFRERHAGEWQGLTKDDIEAAWPGYLADRRRPPGFESDDSLAARTGRGLEDVLAEHHGQRVLVVTHGGVIYHREQMLGASMERIPNLGGRWFHSAPQPARPRSTDTGSGTDGPSSVESVESLSLGDRIILVGEDEVTVPSQL